MAFREIARERVGANSIVAGDFFVPARLGFKTDSYNVDGAIACHPICPARPVTRKAGERGSKAPS